jgi:hypothetical protein
MQRVIDGLTFQRFEDEGEEWVRIDFDGASVTLGWGTLTQFMAEERAEGPGHLMVGLSPDETMVHVQFPPTAETVGWIRLMPDEARQLAALLVKKAAEAESGYSAARH